ncbi:MAG: hypothetical protein ABJC26_09735 [Gemmatimonadaceae bacterium]
MIPDRQFTFDRNSGVVRGPSAKPTALGACANESWTACKHLRAILDEQLNHGACIVYVTGVGTLRSRR